MIAARLFNLRAYKQALVFARKNHNVVYLIYKYNNQVYAIDGLTVDNLETLPIFYTEYLYFWRRTRPQLVKYFNDKICFVGIPDFIQIVNGDDYPLLKETYNAIS